MNVSKPLEAILAAFLLELFIVFFRSKMAALGRSERRKADIPQILCIL